MSFVTATDIQTFTASGTWTKPAGAKIVRVIAIGGGGSGGSGRKSAVGSQASGGLGGGAGGRMEAWFLAADLGATVSVVVPAATTGAAAQPTNSTDGIAGSAAADVSFGTVVLAKGGAGGVGGISVSNGSLAVGGRSFSVEGSGSSAAYTRGLDGGRSFSGAPIAATSFASTDLGRQSTGGGGGGFTDTAIAQDGGAGGGLSPYWNTPAGAGGVADQAGGVARAGDAGTNIQGNIGYGTGGGGGGSSFGANGSGGAGGSGAYPGGGGGGGGACNNGSGSSGVGAAGARGAVTVITFL